MQLKPGSRLHSAVCDTEVVVVKAPARSRSTCAAAGYPMVPQAPTRPEHRGRRGVQRGHADRQALRRRRARARGAVHQGRRRLAVDRRRRAVPEGRQAAAVVGLTTATPHRDLVHLAMLLEMAADGVRRPRRVRPADGGLTYAELARPRPARRRPWSPRARRRAGRARRRELRGRPARAVRRARCAGVPFVPVNYRLDRRPAAGDPRAAPPRRSWSSTTAVAGPLGDDRRRRAGAAARDFLEPDRRRSSRSTTHRWPTPTTSRSCSSRAARPASRRPPCCATGTSRRTSSRTVEFVGADEDEAALVSVPPYHIAGISAVLTSVYAGRRVVLPAERSTPRRGSTRRAPRRSPTRWSCPTMLGPHPRRDRARRRRALPSLRAPVLRRRSDAGRR